MLGFRYLEYMSKKGYLGDGNISILDIGTQNLLFLEEERAVKFVSDMRSSPLASDDIEAIKRLCYFSTPRPGERTAYVSELLELTDIQYVSFDVAPGLSTEILDLNFETLPRKYKNYFDLVINCGTLEHIINQHNCLNTIHDALKVNGVWFDQPPSIGFMNHGYFNYNPLFYRDLSAANDYELIDLWFSPAGMYPKLDDGIPVIDYNTILDDNPADIDTEKNLPAMSYNLNAFMRKTKNERLRLPLEVRTAHAAPNEKIMKSYQNG